MNATLFVEFFYNFLGETYKICNLADFFAIACGSFNKRIMNVTQYKPFKQKSRGPE